MTVSSASSSATDPPARCAPTRAGARCRRSACTWLKFSSTSRRVTPERRSPRCVVDLVDEDRREPERRLVDHQQLASRISPRPSASIRRSPPDRVRPAVRAARRARGKMANTARAAARDRAVRRGKAPSRRFSSTVMSPNGRSPCGMWTRPRDAIVGRSAVDASPANQTRPRVGDRKPLIVRSSVVLPCPFGPITIDELAVADREVDAVQDPRLAVAGSRPLVSSIGASTWCGRVGRPAPCRGRRGSPPRGAGRLRACPRTAAVRGS